MKELNNKSRDLYEIKPENMKSIDISVLIEESSSLREYNPISHNRDSIKPIIILVFISALAIVILNFFDNYTLDIFLNFIENPDKDVIDHFANSSGEIMVGLLALAITVVAIIVQLAANRYTDRVVDLFIKDKINMFMLLMISITGILMLYVNYFARPSDEHYFIPTTIINVTIFLMFVCLILLLPYFIYVFKFLEPASIITRIETDTIKYLSKALRHKRNNTKFRKKIEESQRYVVHGIDQLTDITLNSVEKKDKILATNSIKSIRNFAIKYIELKANSKFSEEWYRPSQFVRYNNADFVTLTDDSFEVLIEEKTWLESKLFCQFENLFRESINKSRDVCNFIAQCLFLIGSYAVSIKDYVIIELIIKYFNTLFRATINEKDVRTCFNLLNQYRLFGEKLVEASEEKYVISIAKYFKYYGLLAREKNLYFILEVVAHDLCDMNKRAYKYGLDKKDEVLDIILTVDVPLEGEKDGSSLRGIRKAQVILATFYLSLETEESFIIAMKIFKDILDEVNLKGGYGRIYAIIKELKYIKKDYWEIIDRGYNFDYVPTPQKIKLLDLLHLLNLRQLIHYALHKIQNQNELANEIVEEFAIVISSLPTIAPIESLEFERFYGTAGLDTRANAIDWLLKVTNPDYTSDEMLDRFLLSYVNINIPSEVWNDLNLIRTQFMNFKDTFLKRVDLIKEHYELY